MTAEAKKRKNQKKKLKQKQKKQAEKVLPGEDGSLEQSQEESGGTESPLVGERSLEEAAESSEIMEKIQQDQGADVNGAVEEKPSEQVTVLDEQESQDPQERTTAEADESIVVPGNRDVEEKHSLERKSVESSSSEGHASESSDIIESLQQDQGTSIDGPLEMKLSHQVRILDDPPAQNSQEGRGIEADHNIVLPRDSEADVFEQDEASTSDNKNSQQLQNPMANSEIIASIQQDQGTSIGHSLEEKLSHEITIMEDAPAQDSVEEKVFEADHNTVLPKSDSDPKAFSELAETTSANEEHSSAPDLQVSQRADVSDPDSNPGQVAPERESIDAAQHSKSPNEDLSVAAGEPSSKSCDSQESASESLQGVDSEADISPEVESDSHPLGSDRTVPENYLPVEESSGVHEEDSSARQTKQNIQAHELFTSDDHERQERMPWESEQVHEQDESNSQSVKTDASAPSTELFTSYGDEESEKMPWETSEAHGSDVEQHYSTIKQPHGEIGTSDKQNLPATIVGEEREKNNVTATPIDADKTNRMINSNHQLDDERNAHSNQLFTNNDDEHEKMPWESDDQAAANVNELGSQNSQTDDHISNINTKSEKEGDDTNGASEQNKVDELAHIFGNDEPEEKFWVSDNNSNAFTPPEESVPKTQDEKQAAGQTTLKFSFLEEDDDLLDDNLSDDGSLLASDDGQEDFFGDRRAVDAGTGVNGANTLKDVNISAQPADEIMRSTGSVSVPSATSGGNRSKYEPHRSYQPANAIPSRAQMAPVDTGILTPQFPLQPTTSQSPKLVESQKVIEKITEEKKKSDAYDFPMDLFPKKNKLAHAKPVGTPIASFPSTAAQQIPVRNPSASQELPIAQNAAKARSGSGSTMPKNPYANFGAIPQTKPPQSPMPPQGPVPPHLNLPSALSPTAGQSVLPPTMPLSPVAYSSKTSARGRGFSNTSAGTAFSPSAPGWIPGQSNGSLEPKIGSLPPQVGKTRTGGRYAPLTPTHPQNVPPTNGTSLNATHGSYGAQFPPTAFPGAQSQAPQMAQAHPLALNIPNATAPSDIVSPVSASSTRRFHARSNSSVYAPNQTEYTSKYAPTVHPQYQYTISAQPPQHPAQLPDPRVASGRERFNNLGNDDFVARMSDVGQPVDNQALLHRQFPLLHWSASDKIVYAVPQTVGQNNFSMSPDSSLQSLNIVSLDSLMPASNMLKSFPGPLVKGKTRNKDVEKWIESVIEDYSSSTLEYTILSLLKLKLTDTATWKDVSHCLYNSDEMLLYLSQPMTEGKLNRTAQKLDPSGQMRILAYLQTGGRDQALTMALNRGDFAMALLIGSLMGKDKWSEIVQQYLLSEFEVESDVSHFSTNLLSLVFQVFVGNSKAAVMEFYSVEKSQWACDHWRIIIAAVLNNIGVNEEGGQLKLGEVPLVVKEFLVEYGVFLTQKGFAAEACAVFLIANIPLSSSSVVDSPVRFAQIGSPMSLESSIFSEIYEFINCADLKGPSPLIRNKLYHAYCLQEHGLTSAASRYADHLASSLKFLPKKEPLALNLASGLNELSTRIAGSSNGWLGRPKLSSVWGQIDKSFNKYIGGDDDSLIKKATDKKVFDGFTPVPSRNSSTLDVSQFQFTPAQNAHHHTDPNLPFLPTGSPMNNPMANFAPRNPLTRTVTEQGPLQQGPPQLPSSFSVDSSPQQIQRKQSASSGVNRLRRARTEQMTAVDSKADQPIFSGLPAEEPKPARGVRNNSSAINLTGSNNLAPSPQISRSSPHHSSTPELLAGRSSVPSSTLLPLESLNSPEELGSAYLPRNNNASSSVEGSIYNKSTDPHQRFQEYESITQKTREAFSPDNSSQVSITGFQNLTKGSNMAQEDEKLTPNTLRNHQVLPPVPNQYVRDEINSLNEPADSTVIRNDLFEFEPEHANESSPNLDREIYHASQVPAEQGSSFMSTYKPASQNFAEVEGIGLRETKHNEAGTQELTNSSEPSFFYDQKPSQPYTKNINPYAPAVDTSIDAGRSKSPPATAEQTKTGTYPYGRYVVQDSSIVPQRENENGFENTPSVMEPSVMEPPVLPGENEVKSSNNRFDPIKPPEALSAETFVPVIKKTPVSRAFTPLVVQPPEVQYDDIVEDESDDEDEEEQKRLREKQEQEERKKEEEERRIREQERSKAAKAKSRDDDNASGWFSWLKKDPNEKKPIKAKLGHKSTFHYDEKLKRWVNKDASEEERQEIASPPPPPPVVKKMDNGPKTKPMASPDGPARDMAGAVLPKNPITGATMGSPLPATSPNDNGPSTLSPSINHPGINLSGKKANGLDDLLSLTGGTAPRRKKKTGRGYVNVMDNK